MDTTTKYHEKFLRLLEKKGKVTAKEVKEELKIDNEKLSSLINQLLGSNDKNALIKSEFKSTIDAAILQITTEGIHYLQRIEQQKLSEEQTKFNRIIALGGSVIAITTLLNFANRDFEIILKGFIGWQGIMGSIIGILLGISLVILAFLLGVEIINIYRKK